MLSEAFYIISGLSQGCADAPLLFNIFLDFVVKIALREMGPEHGILLRYKRKNEEITGVAEWNAEEWQRINPALLYADDCALSADAHDKLQYALSHFSEVFKRFGLNINPKKTKVTILADSDVKSASCEKGFFCDGHPVEIIEDFTYLGSCIEVAQTA